MKDEKRKGENVLQGPVAINKIQRGKVVLKMKYQNCYITIHKQFSELYIIPERSLTQCYLNLDNDKDNKVHYLR